jgi:hypothetical protein
MPTGWRRTTRSRRCSGFSTAGTGERTGDARAGGDALRQQALRFYTRGSAWFSHDDDERGSLEAGKLADLAVLSEDLPHRSRCARSGDIDSVLTMLGGKVVYAAVRSASRAVIVVGAGLHAAHGPTKAGPRLVLPTASIRAGPMRRDVGSLATAASQSRVSCRASALVNAASPASRSTTPPRK